MPTAPATIQDLPALPRDEEGPVFHEPWEAHAFALAVRLSEAGCFSWNEWTIFLSREIRTTPAPADQDAESGYYHHWLHALERLCVAKGLVNTVEMHRRKEAWRQAYLHTPHGQPVDLSAAPTSDQYT
jgi:nitrile hydratase accessory protein